MSVMDTVSLIQETSRDRMGRWVSIRLKRKDQQRITIITAYQISHDSRTGTNTAVNQQMNMILKEAVATGVSTRIKPRAAFIRDLSMFIQHRQSEGDSIILVGDFTETVQESGSGVAQLLTTCGLVDACSQRIGSSNIPSTYKRGPH